MTNPPLLFTEKGSGIWLSISQDKTEDEVQSIKFQSCMEDFIKHANTVTSRAATAGDVNSLVIAVRLQS